MGNFILSLAGFAARLLPGHVKRAIYRFPALAGFIRRSLNRSAPQGLVEIKVAGGSLAGMHLLLDLQTEKDYWLGTYETELVEALPDFVRPGMVAYDAGANIGYISLLLAKLLGPDGRVFAFEALPENLERLERNVRLNGLEERITIVPQAVADRRGEMRFLVGPSGGMGKLEGSAGRQEVAYPGSIPVESTSLDEFVFADGNPPPQILKIDIEGGEELALPGMRRVLETARPAVFLELHGPQAAQTAWEILSQAGYGFHSLGEGYPQVQSMEALGWKSYLVALPAKQDRSPVRENLGQEQVGR